MKVKIKRIEKDLPLPIYETNGSVGFDILARETTTIKPSDIVLIPGNIVVETPKGYMLAIVSRTIRTINLFALARPELISIPE